MTTRNYSNTAQKSSLTAAAGATDTTLTLDSYVGDPTPPFTAALGRGTATEEVVLVTAASGTTVTVVRGYDGTAAQAQGAGTAFQEVVAAMDFREANAHVNATSGVHGATGALVGVSDVQTLTNKTLTAPALASPSITGTATVATANVTTLTVSGATSLAGLTATGTSSLGVTTTGALSATSLTVSGVTTLTGALTANGGVTTTTVTASGALAANGGLTTTTATASGLVKGAGVESTQAVTLAQIAAPAGTASKQTVWAQSDGGLYTRTGTGTVARARVHWGSATSFPSGALTGDTVLRTDLGSTLWTYDGANWWAKEGAVYGKMWRTSGFSGNMNSGQQYTVGFDAARVAGGFTFSDATDQLTIPVDGLISFRARGYATGGPPPYEMYFNVMRTRAGVADIVVCAAYTTKDTGQDRFPYIVDTLPLKAGDKVWMQTGANATGPNYWGSNETTGVLLGAYWAGPLNGATPV